MINVLFAWLPKVFNRLSYLLGNYTNNTVQILIGFSLIVLFILSGLRAYLDGLYLYKLHNIWSALARNVIALN